MVVAVNEHASYRGVSSRRIYICMYVLTFWAALAQVFVCSCIWKQIQKRSSVNKKKKKRKRLSHIYYISISLHNLRNHCLSKTEGDKSKHILCAMRIDGVFTGTAPKTAAALSSIKKVQYRMRQWLSVPFGVPFAEWFPTVHNQYV